jgi:hypothetical protein
MRGDVFGNRATTIVDSAAELDIQLRGVQRALVVRPALPGATVEWPRRLHLVIGITGVRSGRHGATLYSKLCLG